MTERLKEKLPQSPTGLKKLGQESRTDGSFRTVVTYYSYGDKDKILKGGTQEVCDGLTGWEIRVKKTGVIPAVVFNVEPLSREDFLKRTASKNGHLGIPLKDLFVADRKDGLRAGPHIKIKPHHTP